MVVVDVLLLFIIVGKTIAVAVVFVAVVAVVVVAVNDYSHSLTYI